MRDPSLSRFAAARLSPQRRRADLARLRSERFDVVVIGGGVTGAGAALDAASRGLSVALIEARDLAWGTSSRSSKLVHGGLRYLEQLDLGLVHEALRERGLLATRLAPHLVRPLPFLIPLPNGGWRAGAQRGYYGAGVALYDAFAGLFSGSRGMPMHRHLSASAAREIFPSLRRDSVGGAICYYDAQVDDARLVTTLARTAASLGAAVVTSVSATGVTRAAREVTGVRAYDALTDEHFVIGARTVIAATGVWSDDVTEMLGAGVPSGGGVRPEFAVRASKGVHIVVSRSAIRGSAGIILRTEKSVLFIIPWDKHWIIGTTDTDFDKDLSAPAASVDDIDYLLAQANTVLARRLTKADIEGVYAGLRPLVAAAKSSTTALSREHAVVEPMLGLILVAGGKLTTYRVMAQDVVDHAARRLGDVAPSRTAQLPLLGADGFDKLWRTRVAFGPRHGLSTVAGEHLLHRYGSLALDLVSSLADHPEFGKPLTGAPDYLAVEVVYAAMAEGALHLEDALARRTRVSIETAHRGVDSAEHAAKLMGGVLGWDKAKRREEISEYRRLVAQQRLAEASAEEPASDPVGASAQDLAGATDRDRAGAARKSIGKSAAGVISGPFLG